MTRFARGSFIALVLLAAAAITGCSPPRVPLQGSVTYDGKPVESGTVVFVPIVTEGAPAKPNAAITNGHYSFDPATAPTPGNYRVEITWNKKSGEKSKNPDIGDKTEQAIPDKYNTKTELTYEVKAGETTKDFTLAK